MARSKYIYILYDDLGPEGPWLLGAFTVKKEMFQWIERNKEHLEGDDLCYAVAKDGIYKGWRTGESVTKTVRVRDELANTE